MLLNLNSKYQNYLKLDIVGLWARPGGVGWGGAVGVDVIILLVPGLTRDFIPKGSEGLTLTTHTPTS
jgi:hypothetical protein